MVARKPSREERREALEALYAELPQMRCEGLCSDSCYSLAQTPLEQELVRERTGVELDLVQVPPTACPALTMLNRCGVYEVRPMICRLWGMTPGLRCQYGCEPEGGFLSAQQTYEFLARAAELDGDVALARQMREPFEQDPGHAEQVMLALQRDRDLEYQRRAQQAVNPVYLVGRGGCRSGGLGVAGGDDSPARIAGQTRAFWVIPLVRG